MNRTLLRQSTSINHGAQGHGPFSLIPSPGPPRSVCRTVANVRVCLCRDNSTGQTKRRQTLSSPTCPSSVVPTLSVSMDGLCYCLAPPLGPLPHLFQFRRPNPVCVHGRLVLLLSSPHLTQFRRPNHVCVHGPLVLLISFPTWPSSVVPTMSVSTDRLCYCLPHPLSSVV
ncbi:hypothetical protein J6590_003485 [Homalodisca vitripennis]|nr:hypothetical protein J6590_003485 [Homalodisca vitripennis]